MKVYIAGKIAGDSEYRDKFRAAAAALEEDGNVVLNPAELPEGMSPADYMRICFAMIDSADKVVFFPDTVHSNGAILEHQYCLYIGKDFSWYTKPPAKNVEQDPRKKDCSYCGLGSHPCLKCKSSLLSVFAYKAKCEHCSDLDKYEPVDCCPKCGRRLS